MPMPRHNPMVFFTRCIRHGALALSILAVLLQGCAGALAGGAAAGAAVAHDRRSAGVIVDDEAIELKAVTALYSDQALREQTHINVVSYNNVVLLSGEAPSKALRDRAAELVGQINRVRLIHNEVLIAQPSSYVARGQDTLITVRAKAVLLSVQRPQGFDLTRVKVVTEAASVYLMGLLRRSEVEPVVEKIRRVNGVRRVVKLFEYID